MGRLKEAPESKGRKILNIAGLLEKGVSVEKIRTSLGVGKDLISSVRTVMIENGLNYEDMRAMNETELADLIKDKDGKEKENKVNQCPYREPDYAYFAKELMKPGVTKQLLWEEYRDNCQLCGDIPYQLTQFKVHLNEYISKQSYAILITHKPGELIEVDWTGDRARWFDPDTGEEVYGWLFVGVLSFSGLTYAEVFADMKEANWIKAHNDMFQYFHGVTPTLRCDNLRTGVTNHSKNGEYVLQEDYRGLGAYYGIAIVPGKPLAPKTKPLAENSVKNCEMRLLAALRNEVCYSLEDYNRKLSEKLEQFNNKPFQKKKGSRRSLYEEYEKETLGALPIREYEYCKQAIVKVQSDGFIGFDKNFYSVPDKRPGETVSVCAYQDRVEIYDGLTRLAIHKRAIRGAYKKVYDPSHFTNTNKGEWNKDRFLNWASSIGTATYQVVSLIFMNGPEQIYYKSVHSLLKLADKYTKKRLESACLLALRKVDRPTYRLIKSILANNQDIKEGTSSEEDMTKPKRKEYSYLGKDYE